MSRANDNTFRDKESQSRTLVVLGKQLLRLKDIVPQHMTPERILRVAMMQVDASTALKTANPVTVVRAVLQAAALGLEVGSVLGEAYLVPFDGACTLIPGYRGYVKLMHQTGDIHNIRARHVYAGDEFKATYGLHEDIVHVPNLQGDRSDEAMIALYTVIEYKAGGPPKFDVITRDEWEKVRKASRAGFSTQKNPNPPWEKWYPQMVQKTGIRRMIKLTPTSWQVQAASELDNRFDLGTKTEPMEALDFEDIEDEFQTAAARTKLDEARVKVEEENKRRAEAEKKKNGATAKIVQDAEWEEEQRRQEALDRGDIP